MLFKEGGDISTRHCELSKQEHQSYNNALFLVSRVSSDILSSHTSLQRSLCFTHLSLHVFGMFCNIECEQSHLLRFHRNVIILSMIDFPTQWYDSLSSRGFYLGGVVGDNKFDLKWSPLDVIAISATRGAISRWDECGSCAGAEPDVSNCRHFLEEGNASKKGGSITTVRDFCLWL